MSQLVLGLDIGGANLKAASSEQQSVSLPFPLWREPDNLSAKLAELIAHFPHIDSFAVTMTGELCDCYQTKREGVNAILSAVEKLAGKQPIRVWSTDDRFLTVDNARKNYLKVAAANWHALATFAGRYVREGPAILLDIGSTTTDIIPLQNGTPISMGQTDPERLTAGELLYRGVRRTPLCALMGSKGAGELFATTRDLFLARGRLPDDPTDTDTADGRLATRELALARLSRMCCSDPELMSRKQILSLAKSLEETLLQELSAAIAGRREHLRRVLKRKAAPCIPLITSGSGEFLAKPLMDSDYLARKEFSLISLNQQLGPELSECAPAYALAVLAQERPTKR